MYDLKVLELVYKNASSEEELDASLEYHEISREDFFALASEKGWTPGPMALNTIVSNASLIEADASFIDGSNKASVRRMQVILEYAAAKLQSTMLEMAPSALIDQLDSISKVGERLIKLERPMYGLTTSEPLPIPNPFQIVINSQAIEEIEEEAPEEDND